jgi:hypothetical protein
MQACATDKNPTPANTQANASPASGTTDKHFPDGWLVTTDYVFDGGVGKDGIRSIDKPTYKTPAEIDFLQDDELVAMVKFNDEIKVFPIQILNYHEIVNTVFGDDRITISHCPLTGTSVAWAGESNGLNTEYGVSGLLYNNNLIMYDRERDGYWSQMKSLAIFGENVCGPSHTIQIIETTWKTFKSMDLEALVLDEKTGFARNYSRYPYGDYITNDDYILFPTETRDFSLDPKDRVHLIVESIEDHQTATVIRSDRSLFHESGGMLIIGDVSLNIFVSFYDEVADGTDLSFVASERDLPIILEDNEGNVWNIFGEAVEGPRTGEKLKPTYSMMSYWFPIASMYDQTLIVATHPDGG